jgi:hypothetical protein
MKLLFNHKDNEKLVYHDSPLQSCVSFQDQQLCKLEFFAFFIKEKKVFPFLFVHEDGKISRLFVK